MVQKRYVWCLAAVMGLVLAGCGSLERDQEEEQASVVGPSPTTTPSPTPAPTPAPTPTPTPTPTPSPTPTPTLAYVPDLKPVFDSDCTRCHSGSRPSANYDMSTYAGVMAMVQAGSASSRLVVATRSNGSMYPHFTGDRAAKADLVLRWVVNNGAAASR